MKRGKAGLRRYSNEKNITPHLWRDYAVGLPEGEVIGQRWGQSGHGKPDKREGENCLGTLEGLVQQVKKHL